MPKIRGLGQFADLRRGLASKRGEVDTPIHAVNVTYFLRNF